MSLFVIYALLSVCVTEDLEQYNYPFYFSSLSENISVARCTDTSKVSQFSEIKNVMIPKFISIDTSKNDCVLDF